MTPDEIVKALKLCAGDRCCEGCIEEQSVRHWQIVMRESADLIESLQTQLADYHHISELVDGKMGENQRLRRINENLQEQISASQRRERAAVEDLSGTGACFTCKHFRRNGGDCFGAGRCRLDGIEIWPCNKPGSCEGCKREIKPFPCYPCWWCVQFQRILRRPLFYRKYKARKGGKDG